MKSRFITTTVSLAAALAVAAPASAATPPVQISGFSLSPACVKPGSSVSASATVHNTTLLPQSFYSHWNVSEGGYQVYDGTTGGPYSVPPLATGSQSQNTQIPWYTPWGSYTVTLTIGPSSTDSSSWDQRSEPLTVGPWC